MARSRMIENRFELLEEVGNGRMSTVFLAQDTANGGLRVAVKVLNTAHSDAIKREVFKRETNALRKLRHPNVVGMRDRAGGRTRARSTLSWITTVTRSNRLSGESRRRSR